MHASTVSVNLLLIVISLLGPTTGAQQYTYIGHDCPNTTNFTVNSTYQANRDSLLASLSSNSTRGDGFYNTTSGRGADMVYGLFLCLGDLSTDDCQACVAYAADDISRRCPVERTAVVWYNVCLLRYSNQNIFSIVTKEPPNPITLFNTRNFANQDLFNGAVEYATQLIMAAISSPAENETQNFATITVNVSSYETLYTLGKCTPDLSSEDCNSCLRFAREELQNGSQGGRVFTPSCYLRYENYQFYNQTAQTAVALPPPSTPLPPAPEGDKPNNSNRTLVLVATLSATFGLLVVSLSGFIFWRRRNSRGKNSQGGQFLHMVEGRIPNEYSRETFIGENGDRSQKFPSIQLDILHAATNHFSDENKLGEGGFGPVYKGILPDGKEIAVKRLSKTSGQGLVEFKNEIMLIARLQHRNLVRLLGFCLEKNEKLLVYEFLPNKSLDVFLFNSKFAVQLDWQKRFNIIKGIARGILYLHEDSRLRIIHRDLKASNVLLDNEMNPKISDFGMARIFEDKNEANTNRVVGTYGYMSPEYAMQGLFSIKSDVFSFGVLLLEIISGKRNNSFHLSESGESLLTFAWKLWSKGEAMELIDKILVSSCVASAVLKCIHIGLLCVQEDPADRPTMSTVIVMMASDSAISLAHPTEPAFSVGRVVSEPSEPMSDDGVCSVNEVTISNFSPR